MREQIEMLYSISGIARLLGISEPTARKLALQLPAVTVGKQKRYAAQSIAELVKSKTAPAQQVSA